MSDKKAVAVTAIMVAMLVIIMMGLFLLGYNIALAIIIGVLAIVGLERSALALCKWLSAEKETDDLDPAPIVVGDEVQMTVDDIIAEMGELK